MANYKLSNIQKVADDIQTITIQGATNIAKAACTIMAQEISSQSFESVAELTGFFEEGARILSSARETEPQLFNAMSYGRRTLEQHETLPVQEVTARLAESFLHYIVMIKEGDERRDQFGASIIKPMSIILTHCHAGSVINTLKVAHATKNIQVINTETRPLYQGRKTSNDLIKAGIPTTMIVDSFAPYCLSREFGKEIDVAMIMIGCDAIKLDGSIYNKVGSFAIASTGFHTSNPVYVAGNLLKMDLSSIVTIEQRKGEEIWPDAPSELRFLNYAFDHVPAKYITGIITEFGIIKPQDIAETVTKNYPRMIPHPRTANF
jgi:eIF-2B alpha/beta/delta-like uncharacterized protein